MKDYSELILDSLPHWAMLIDSRTRTILAANKKAKELGSKIQGQCWDDFGHRAALSEEHLEIITNHPERHRDNCIKCTFCKADESIFDGKTYVEDVEIDGTIWKTYWVPVEPHTYLHYAIDLTEHIKLEKLEIEKEKLEAVISTIAAVSHELAQPTMVVMGYIEMLRYDMEDLGSEFNFDKISGPLSKLKDIINKLQAITTIKMKQYMEGEILDIDKSSLESIKNKTTSK